MIFDEATSSLDVITEASIVETIRKLGRDQGLIVLIVAHRLRTTKDADLICVMDRGEITERGCHEELLRNDGMYRALWRVQHGYEGL
jgi:ABC-type multidrug transport system fused ATPase/permease subunit